MLLSRLKRSSEVRSTWYGKWPRDCVQGQAYSAGASRSYLDTNQPRIGEEGEASANCRIRLMTPFLTQISCPRLCRDKPAEAAQR
jgi:hypothetical protein